LEYARYERQIGLPEVGRKGQKRLFASKVLVIGAGGLGSPILYYLVAAGVGTVGIVDGDEVSVSNLNRQILHWTEDLGRLKTDSASEKLRRFNASSDIRTHNLNLDDDNAEGIISGYDLVLAAVDRQETRRVINRACFKLKIPWINGGVDRFSGMVTSYCPPEGPCYECLAAGMPIDAGPSPQLLGSLAGTIGLLQTQEALKFILKIGTPLVGRILFYDALLPSFDIINLPANPACPVCGSAR